MTVPIFAANAQDAPVRAADKQAAEEVVSKKLKAAASAALAIDGQALVQFVDPDGLLNQLLENAEEMPYSFHLEETEITSNLADSFGKLAGQSTEPWRWAAGRAQVVNLATPTAWR
eukprot:Skav227508  [mRNA]  locus=scaffold282:273556:276104:+ [translate_table: standard]